MHDVSSYVHWVIELKIAKGKTAEFKAFADEAVASARQEPGTLGYDWNLAEDGKTVHIYECFKDSAAVLEHMQRFGKLRARFGTLITPVSFTLYGSPSDELRALLSSRGVRYFTPIAGFIR